jgi:hypothetical protein
VKALADAARTASRTARIMFKRSMCGLGVWYVFLIEWVWQYHTFFIDNKISFSKWPSAGFHHHDVIDVPSYCLESSEHSLWGQKHESRVHLALQNKDERHIRRPHGPHASWPIGPCLIILCKVIWLPHKPITRNRPELCDNLCRQPIRSQYLRLPLYNHASHEPSRASVSVACGVSLRAFRHRPGS